MPQDPTPAPQQSLVGRVLACWRGLGPAGPLLLLAGGGPIVGLFALVATASTWLPWFEAGGAAEAGAFLALGVVLAAACLTPTHATSLVAGYVFGALGGAIPTPGSLRVTLPEACRGPQACRSTRR